MFLKKYESIVFLSRQIIFDIIRDKLFSLCYIIKTICSR